MILEQFVEASKREAENIQTKNKTGVERKIENETVIVDINNDISWFLRDDGSWNASFLDREGVNISSLSENRTFAKNVENDDSLSNKEENPNGVVEDGKSSLENVHEKIAKAVEAIKRVKEDDETYLFLRHPGTLYHMEKATQGSLQNGNTGFILRDYSTEENCLFTRNIRLDIVNMVIDHLPPGYEEALNNLCP